MQRGSTSRSNLDRGGSYLRQKGREKKVPSFLGEETHSRVKKRASHRRTLATKTRPLGRKAGTRREKIKLPHRLHPQTAQMN